MELFLLVGYEQPNWSSGQTCMECSNAFPALFFGFVINTIAAFHLGQYKPSSHFTKELLAYVIFPSLYFQDKSKLN